MHKPLIVAAMVGIGWVIAQFPILWNYLPYLIPAISVCMLLLCIVKTLKG